MIATPGPMMPLPNTGSGTSLSDTTVPANGDITSVVTPASPAALVAAAWLLCGIPFAARRLPARRILESAMHRLIAVGFVFFSIATVLGALWAAEAWGSYWSWDPKETWALIVWLNYAAWLHMRLTGSARGTLAAWWALGGLLVTLFAFLGVNMYLSGLHSYGGL